jgi:hypothetical protein
MEEIYFDSLNVRIKQIKETSKNVKNVKTSAIYRVNIAQMLQIFKMLKSFLKGTVQRKLIGSKSGVNR